MARSTGRAAGRFAPSCRTRPAPSGERSKSNAWSFVGNGNPACAFLQAMQPCSLLSLATAVPPVVIEQAEAKAHARAVWGGGTALFDRLSSVFDNAGIARRHIVAPKDWYMHRHGWHDRNAVYLESSDNLFVEAASAAIE